MRVEIRGVVLRVGVTAAACCACWINYGSFSLFCFGVTAVMLHELTHILMMRYYGCGRITAEVLPGGIRILSDDLIRTGYRQTVAVLLSAPVCNLLAGIAFAVWNVRAPDPILIRNAGLHLALGGINLLPFSFLDGGRALKCILSAKSREYDAGIDAGKVDGICLFGLATVIVLLAVRRIFPLSLYAFFLYTVIYTATKKARE